MTMVGGSIEDVSRCFGDVGGGEPFIVLAKGYQVLWFLPQLPCRFSRLTWRRKQQQESIGSLAAVPLEGNGRQPQGRPRYHPATKQYLVPGGMTNDCAKGSRLND